ncbi:glyoxalase superfamily protein [Roseomonas sp. CCTCC AB2023176]|uniref:glyoxalase superfamily protein n=1 Tax=Roseomonas sp. CCTCC AB2023176 TaxID=3342640 RepID=UPI0035D73E53
MTPAFGRAIPVLRSFDEDKAREFYLDFLGFSVDFEHRFAPDLPLFMQVSRGGLVLRLSEHHGDGSPGANVTVQATGLDALRDELLAKAYRYARPGIEEMPWGTREFRVTDPFGNRLVFEERAPAP